MTFVSLASIDRLGQRTLEEARWVREIFALLYLTIKQFWLTFVDQAAGRKKGIGAVVRVVVMQVYFTGVQSLTIVSLLALTIGSVVVLQSITQLSRIGGINQLGEMVVFSIIRDVGPLLTTLIIIARSGTAVAAEISTMKVNHEIDALVSLGISPLNYIVVPRVIGGIISVLAISIWFSTIGVLGGFIFSALLLNVHWTFYIDKIFLALSGTDLIFFVIKSVLGGGAVFLIACLQGMSARIASYEVPIVTIACVMKSLSFCLVFHAATTILFYSLTSPRFQTMIGEFLPWN